MLPLYPEIKPYARHQLDVDELHQLYIDESGTVDGIPVVFLWYSYGIPVVFLWYSCGIPVAFFNIPVVVLWYPCGILW